MKKILAILIIMIMLTGCTGTKEPAKTTTSSTMAETSKSTTFVAESEEVVEGSESAEVNNTSVTTIKNAECLPTDAIATVKYDDISLLKYKLTQTGLTEKESDVDADLVKKAKEMLFESKYYSETVAALNDESSIDVEMVKGMFKEYYDGDILVPLFNFAVTDDFDGNGTYESFVGIDIPDGIWIWCASTYIVFISSNGDAEIVSCGSLLDSVYQIDYGSFKHIDIQYGHNNSTIKYEILSVNGNTAKLELRNCHRGSQILNNRIMRFQGIQQICEMAVFWDNEDRCYKQLGGVEYDLDKFNEFYSGSPYEVESVLVFGNRYYVININGEFEVYPLDFTYQNGEFDFDDSGLGTTDGKDVSYDLDFYIDDGIGKASIPPVAYLDLSDYDE